VATSPSNLIYLVFHNANAAGIDLCGAVDNVVTVTCQSDTMAGENSRKLRELPLFCQHVLCVKLLPNRLRVIQADKTQRRHGRMVFISPKPGCARPSLGPHGLVPVMKVIEALSTAESFGDG
jgi:hypothetical protein